LGFFREKKKKKRKRCTPGSKSRQGKDKKKSARDFGMYQRTDTFKTDIVRGEKKQILKIQQVGHMDDRK
jgi:hypothetical protein